jgi:hypothetical protein
LLDTQVFEVAGVGEPVNWVVALTQMVVFPVTVGLALTVIVKVFEHPTLLV